MNVIKKFFLRLVVIIILTFLLEHSSFAKYQLEIGFSKIHSLMLYLQSISKDPRHPTFCFEQFKNSRFYNQEAEKKLEGFRSFIQDNLDLESNLLSLSAEYQSLGEYVAKLKASTQLQEDQIETLQDVLNYFEPAFEELLWKKNLASLERQSIHFTELLKKYPIQKWLGEIANFYGTKWDESQKIRLYIFPNEESDGVSYAESFGAFNQIALNVNSSALDYEEILAIFIHEISHAFYKSQTKELKHTWENVFKISDKKNAKYAYWFLNEALATAIGNGWAYEQMTGRIKRNWYNNVYIQGFAKAIFLNVKETLNQSKTLDEKGLEELIEIFEKAFPQAYQDPHVHFFRLNLIIGDAFSENTEEIFEGLFSKFRISSIDVAPKLEELKTADIFERDFSSTSVFVLKLSELENLNKLSDDIKKRMNGLEDILKLNKPGVFEFSGSDGYRYYLIVLEEIEEFSRRLDGLLIPKK